MTTTPTPALPPLPEPDGELEIIVVGRSVVIDAYRASTLEEYGRACIAQASAARVPSDAEILALNKDERFFSESPSKFPEAGHGTQYHAGAPGVIGFARALLASSSGGSDSQTLIDAYALGWLACSDWAQRDDLVSDIGSPAYIADREKMLSGMSASTAGAASPTLPAPAPQEVKPRWTREQVLQALHEMDDYAGMVIGVAASEPMRVLAEFIEDATGKKTS